MSSNWSKLQQVLKKGGGGKPGRNSRKRDLDDARTASPPPSKSSYHDGAEQEVGTSSSTDGNIQSLRKMVEGRAQFTEKQRLPGKYLSMDCEMVGVGPQGDESSLARVSLVNFYGVVILDEFVKPRERVVDYRTQYSGIRPSDLVHARTFGEVQRQVADLLTDRILVGHAVHNDLKVLLLSHPYPLTRDTQALAFKSKITKAKRIALRNLVKQELNLNIQQGEHSSVVDARATMAIYRLHKKSWDSPLGPYSRATGTPGESSSASGKRKASALDDDGEVQEPLNKKAKSSPTKDHLPGPAGRKGVSSGLSTVVRRGAGKGKSNQGARGGGDQEKEKWWTKLPTKGTGSKGSMKL